MQELRAGVCARELPTPLGVAMMGYGARTGSAEGVHDALRVRALHLAQGERELLLLESDLCLIAPAQADLVRARLCERTGLAPACVMVGCIHTHSGPDTGLGALLADRPAPAYVAPLLDAMVDAGVAARAAAAPARLGVGHARAAIGRNRRVADGAIDPEVLVVRVDDAGGAPRAVLYVHGCHPTALGHDNLAYSADWPGAASAAIEAALPGATAIFALGAHADVDPRTRGLLDLGVPDRSAGVSIEQAHALGRELGDAVAAAAARIATEPRVPVAVASTRVPLCVHPGLRDAGERESALARLRAQALAALDLPDDPGLGTQDLYRLERERMQGLGPAERRARVASVRRYLRERTAPRFAGGLEARVEAQVLRLGPAWLLALPLEATVDVGLDWKERLRERGPAAVVSIANGWLRYLPHARNFAEPGAGSKYEILQSTFVPEAAERLLDAGESLAAALDAS